MKKSDGGEQSYQDAPKKPYHMSLAADHNNKGFRGILSRTAMHAHAVVNKMAKTNERVTHQRNLGDRDKRKWSGVKRILLSRR
jgi:hypothetical protein